MLIIGISSSELFRNKINVDISSYGNDLKFSDTDVWLGKQCRPKSDCSGAV